MTFVPASDPRKRARSWSTQPARPQPKRHQRVPLPDPRAIQHDRLQSSQAAALLLRCPAVHVRGTSRARPSSHCRDGRHLIAGSRSAQASHSASRGVWRYTIARPSRSIPPHRAQQVALCTIVSHQRPAEDPVRRDSCCAATTATFFRLFFSRCRKPIISLLMVVTHSPARRLTASHRFAQAIAPLLRDGSPNNCLSPRPPGTHTDGSLWLAAGAAGWRLPDERPCHPAVRRMHTGLPARGPRPTARRARTCRPGPPGVARYSGATTTLTASGVSGDRLAGRFSSLRGRIPATPTSVVTLARDTCATVEHPGPAVLGGCPAVETSRSEADSALALPAPRCGTCPVL
jgi:hypothetical protein